MSGAFGGFYQLAYVTTDRAAALRRFSDCYGVSHWYRAEDPLPLADGRRVEMKLALAFAGALQLEVIEPVGGADAIYRDALDWRGFDLRWHHVGFKVADDVALARQRHGAAERGERIALEGGTSQARFFYADATARLGHHLEYFALSPERELFDAGLPRN